MRTIQNVPDIKDSLGNWKRSYMVDGVRYFTRAGMIWGAVEARCNPAGSVQSRMKSYEGVTNSFENFQHFTEWCHNECGYLNRESSGKYWCLDKDILVIGNRQYSPETCCFVPTRLNSLLGTHANRKTSLPIGVSFRKDMQKYNAQVSNGVGNRLSVSGFTDPFSAHRKYQEIKIGVISSVLEELREVLPAKVIEGVNRHLSSIENDYNNHRETFR